MEAQVQSQSSIYEQLNRIIAIMLLTFTFAQLVTLPSREFSFQFAGIYFAFNFNLKNIFALLNVAIVTTGSFTIFNQRAKRRRISLVHAILPALTTWMISIPLFATTLNLLWWVELILFGALLFLIIYAEYLVADEVEEQYEQLLSRLLESVAFAIFFIISAILFAINMRLSFMLPPLFLLTFFISLRLFELRTSQWLIFESLTMAFIIAQFAAVFNYFNFSAIPLGILLFGILYSLNNFILKTNQKKIQLPIVIESTIILVITVLLAIFLQIT